MEETAKQELDQKLRDSGPDSLKMVATKTEDGGVKFQHAYQAIEEKTYTPPPITVRAFDKRAAEFEAGRQRVAIFEEIKRTRPKPVISEKERMSMGQSNPVFRPNLVSADKSRLKGQDRGLDAQFAKIGANVKVPVIDQEPEGPTKEMDPDKD